MFYSVLTEAEAHKKIQVKQIQDKKSHLIKDLRTNVTDHELTPGCLLTEQETFRHDLVDISREVLQVSPFNDLPKLIHLLPNLSPQARD